MESETIFEEEKQSNDDGIINHLANQFQNVILEEAIPLENYYLSLPDKYKRSIYNPYEDMHGLSVPFRMLFIGSSGAGKTNTLMNLIVGVFGDTFSYILICVKHKQEPLYQYLEDKFQEMGFGRRLVIVEGVERLPPVDSWTKDGSNYLLVADDLLQEDLTRLGDYAIRGRKHGVSTIFLSQSFIHDDASFKLIRKNATHVVLHRVGINRELQEIYQQYSLGVTKEEFVKKYEEFVVRSPHLAAFLTIDIFAPTMERRFRRNFHFPGARTMNNVFAYTRWHGTPATFTPFSNGFDPSAPLPPPPPTNAAAPRRRNTATRGRRHNHPRNNRSPAASIFEEEV